MRKTLPSALRGRPPRRHFLQGGPREHRWLALPHVAVCPSSLSLAGREQTGVILPKVRLSQSRAPQCRPSRGPSQSHP